MAKKDESSIYIDLQELFKVLYRGQFGCDKRDRIALFNRMMDHNEKCITYFSLAFDSSDKIHQVEMLVGEFDILKVECRMAIDIEIIKQESLKNQIREYIVKIQDGIDKWRSYLYSARHE